MPAATWISQLSRSWTVLLTTRPTTMRLRHRQHDDRRCRRVDGIDQIAFELELTKMASNP